MGDPVLNLFGSLDFTLAASSKPSRVRLSGAIIGSAFCCASLPEDFPAGAFAFFSLGVAGLAPSAFAGAGFFSCGLLSASLINLYVFADLASLLRITPTVFRGPLRVRALVEVR